MSPTAVFESLPQLYRRAIEVFAVGVAYYLGARLGLALSIGPNFVAPLWPPNAVLLAALLLSAPRRWPWFLAVAVPAELAADLPGGISLVNALAFVVADWIEVVVGATLFRHFVSSPLRFSNLRNASFYVACCVVVGPLVASIPGALASSVGVEGSSLSGSWRSWVVGDALTHFVVTPMLILWIAGGRTRKRPRSGWRYAESVFVMVGLAVVTALSLATTGPSISKIPILVYAPFPFLLWAAIRFRPRFVATAAALVAVTAVWGARQGLGPFVDNPMDVNVIHLQAFLFLMLAPLLLLSTLVSERNRAERERRQLEDRLRHVEKMEAIGQMAGGIAHDFNNLLTGILGNADLLRDGLDPASEDRKMLDEITVASRRAADLTRQLLAFSRRAPAQRVALDVCRQIDEAVGLLGRSIDKSIDIRTDHKTGTVMMEGDPGQLHNALLNLGLNARDAMPEGGELRFSTASVTLGETECARYPESPAPGPYAVIEVSDTGQGMDTETLGKIFEPFFTTKEKGRGTGLGLAAVYGFVRGHGGVITVDSAVGEGTVFRILLPAAAHGASDLQSSPQVGGRERRSRGGVILVIDDEQPVRKVVRRALEPLGFRLVDRWDGVSGVTEFEASHSDLDLVILDLVMPKMSGHEVLRRIRSIDPSVPVIVVSGYTDVDGDKVTAEEGVFAVLRKPFEVEKLQALVLKACGPRPKGPPSQGRN